MGQINKKCPAALRRWNGIQKRQNMEQETNASRKKKTKMAKGNRKEKEEIKTGRKTEKQDMKHAKKTQGNKPEKDKQIKEKQRPKPGNPKTEQKNKVKATIANKRESRHGMKRQRRRGRCKRQRFRTTLEVAATAPSTFKEVSFPSRDTLPPASTQITASRALKTATQAKQVNQALNRKHNPEE